MSKRKTTLSRLSVAVSLAVGSFVAANVQASDINVADQQPEFVKQVNPLGEDKKPSYSSVGKSTYIVQLQNPSIALYGGGIQNMSATSLKATGKNKLDAKAPEVQQYHQFLKSQQSSMLQSSEKLLGRTLQTKFQYTHVLNGMALELTDSEAEMMRRMPQVISIEKETIQPLNTDSGHAWIGADSFWDFNGDDDSGMTGNKGEGVVVAVLDTGINHDHPSFADIGGDGYDHINPLGSGNYIPGSYCDVVDPGFCNDKLIGAWGLVAGPTDPTSPEDSDGHGSHTASTAAGNVIVGATLEASTTELVRDISGVAPHANIIAYDVCIDSCPGAALLAAVEQVVIDSSVLPNGIQALNYSISGGNDPYNDAVELGFLNATAAGIYVATSAGNSGPGASTTGHNSPWVSTTAAMTHDRTIVNTVTDMTSDGASLANLEGKGFTAPYGPASIVYAGDHPTANGSSNDTNPAQCLEPFPAGHFSGEIVICDRGAIARVAKGANVLAGGAGGLVLANAEGNGESTSGDAHFLPAVHLGYTDGQILKDWVANNTNTAGSITGAVVKSDPGQADMTAGFSSRGPNLAIDIIKPDIGGPGVDIFAAAPTTQAGSNDEYMFLSGTSMSSPHNAGAGALVSGSTGWTPYEIKSAIMMTAETDGLTKDDGVTEADPFDVGAGRIDLRRVLNAGLVLDETPENFLAANPDAGGDPKTLNIASMQDSSCVQSCSWTRTVKNVSNDDGEWELKAKTNAEGVKVSVSPREIELDPGETAEITVTMDTAFATEDWTFAELQLKPDEDEMTRLHMPVAAYAAKSTSAFLSASVDAPQAWKRDVLTYSIDLSNGPIDGTINLDNVLPDGLEYVEGSATQTITNGTTESEFGFDGNAMTWSGTLAKSDVTLSATFTSPAGYLPLSIFGIAPQPCPDNCDDGGVIFNINPFKFNGETYSSILWSVNGTVEVGAESGLATTAASHQLPDAATPNNLLAPLWTDLDLSAGGNFYIGALGNGVTSWTILEWENVPRYGTDPSDPANTHTFQVWIQSDDSGNIWYTYGPQGDLSNARATVGVENDTGTTGTSVFYNGTGVAPANGYELQVQSVLGGQANFTFEAEVKKCKKKEGIVNRVEISSNGVSETAIATTQCTK